MALPDDFEGGDRRLRASRRGRPDLRIGRLSGQRPLLPRVERGEFLATFSAGAYGMAMSSNYNGGRARAEVMVDGKDVRLIRRRETYADLVAQEIF